MSGVRGQLGRGEEREERRLRCEDEQLGEGGAGPQTHSSPAQFSSTAPLRGSTAPEYGSPAVQQGAPQEAEPHSEACSSAAVVVEGRIPERPPLLEGGAEGGPGHLRAWVK